MAFKLSAAVVIEFAQIKAQIAALEERKKAMCELIKPIMYKQKVGEYLPEESPYKLVFSVYDRKDISWKEECEELARKLYGKKFKEEIEKIKEQAPVKEIQELEVKPNENYRLP